jgi:hypothetical protein
MERDGAKKVSDIISVLRRQLGWTHIKTIMYLKEELQRQFVSMSRKQIGNKASL